MNRRVPALVAGAFVAGALAGALAIDSAARPTRASVPSTYANGLYGFSLVPPALGKVEPGSGGQTALFFGPPRNGFASNLGVMVQNVKMTLDDYVKLSRDQFEQGGLKVSSETRTKVSGRDAVVWEYEGAAQGRKLRWIAQAVVDGERVFLITGTCTRDEYEAAAKEFRASLDSFRISD